MFGHHFIALYLVSKAMQIYMKMHVPNYHHMQKLKEIINELLVMKSFQQLTINLKCISSMTFRCFVFHLATKHNYNHTMHACNCYILLLLCNMTIPCLQTLAVFASGPQCSVKEIPHLVLFAHILPFVLHSTHAISLLITCYFPSGFFEHL